MGEKWAAFDWMNRFIVTVFHAECRSVQTNERKKKKMKSEMIEVTNKQNEKKKVELKSIDTPHAPYRPIHRSHKTKQLAERQRMDGRKKQKTKLHIKTQRCTHCE